MAAMDGQQVYVPSEGELAWLPGTVVSVEGDQFTVKFDSASLDNATLEDAQAPNEEDCLTISSDAPGLESFESLPLQNTNLPDDGCPDMCNLNYLHEPAILYNLRTRFLAVKPYTYTGDICIAVNPYQWLDLYSADLRTAFIERPREELPPHAYAVSATAYNSLRSERGDQSILVSGESGAGKTETVKILMNHLASAGGNHHSEVIQRVLDSNPLLESFGNAKTVRNDNSSRFGKFTQLQFDMGGALTELVGSRCEHYLLEKTRVVALSPGERTYHVFYQLVRAPGDARAAFEMSGASIDTFSYMRDGDLETAEIEGQQDSEKFHTTAATLGLIGVDEPVIASLRCVLSAVMWMGQIDLDDAGDEKSEVSNMVALETVARLLKTTPEAVSAGLTTRTMRTRSETIQVQLRADQAIDGRDGFAKEIYARVFNWLVSCINKSTTNTQPDQKLGLISLLDIFGFESFKVNRFEQLCINWANERLQQKFTQDVFKTVQTEYTEEGIKWDHIAFADNADMLDVVEGNLGIISILNEECIRPRGDDEGFTGKLTSAFQTHKRFKKARMSRTEFTLHHYAGSVTYTTVGFVDKNKDQLSEDLSAAMLVSEDPLVQKLFEPVKETSEGASKSRRRGSSLMAETVTSKFRRQLLQLMTAISSTEVQYVRCIKPNRVKSPQKMNNLMVVEQLRCAGVIEAIRISRAGYPNRLPHGDFVSRFEMLCPGLSLASNDATPEKCVAVLKQLMPEASLGEYQLGLTKIYFKAGYLETLEEMRSAAVQERVLVIQKRARAWQAQRKFLIVKACLVLMQTHARRFNDQLRFRRTKRDVVLIQGQARKMAAARRVTNLRRLRMATKLQSLHRRLQQQRRFRKLRAAVVRVQTCLRMLMARHAFKIALAQAKEDAKLENQVKALQEQMRAQQEAHQKEMERAMQAAKAGAAAAPGADGGVVSPKSPRLLAAAATEADRMKESELMNRSREMIEHFRKETMRLRNENQKLKEEVSKLKNDKYVMANSSAGAGASFNALSNELQKRIKVNRDLTEQNKHLHKLLKQRSDELEIHEALKINQMESIVKQQEIMNRMLDTAKKNGASPTLILELEMLSSPDFSELSSLDMLDTHSNSRGHQRSGLLETARNLKFW